ncbi:MAG: hypothetical protein ACOYM3_08030 [Terrimicrobiaceae bacterium]
MIPNPGLSNQMKSAVILLLLFIAFFFTGCSRHSASISDMDDALTRQFKFQWQQRKDPLDKRIIKEVHIGRFYKPTGNEAFYAEIEVLTEDKRIITGSPLVPLGDSSVAVSFAMPDNGPSLNAIINFNQ